MFSESGKQFFNKDKEMTDEKACELEVLTDKVVQEIDDICDKMLEVVYKFPDDFMSLPGDKREEFNDAFRKIIKFSFFQMKIDSTIERVNKVLKKKLIT